MQKNAQLNPNDNSEPSFKDNRAYFQVNKSRIRINYRAHHSDPDLSPSNDTDLSKDLRVHQRLKSKIVRDKDRGKKLLLSLSLISRRPLPRFRETNLDDHNPRLEKPWPVARQFESRFCQCSGKLTLDPGQGNFMKAINPRPPRIYLHRDTR